MRYQIICHTLNANGSIDKLGVIPEGGNTNQAQNIIEKEEVNRLIRIGHSFFFTNVHGQKVEVISVEHDYVRTKPDGTRHNNLLELRACRIQ